jgi:signal transduction histidine kinase
MAVSVSFAERLEGRRLVRWSLLVLTVSVLVGTFLFHIFYGLDQVAERWTDYLANVYYSFIYTVTMFASLKGTAHWLRGRVPLRSRRAVAVHVGGLSLAAVGSYGLATGICQGLHPAGFGMEWEILVVTATIAFLVTLVWSAFMYLNAFYQELRAAEAAKYEARLEALRAQINPHFLFNAFNSIAALIRTRPDEAETVVEDLADLFRYTLRASKTDVSTVEKEVEAARRYLAVEKARFRDRLIVEVDVPEPLQSVTLPGMTIQPLVENAVKHGVGETKGDCTVAIAVQRENEYLVLRVTDTGPGFETTDLDAVLDEGTGLGNVRERLRLFYGDDAQMRLLDQGVEIVVPIAGSGDEGRFARRENTPTFFGREAESAV